MDLKSIRHYVISRFPVITDNERIIAWNALSQSAVFRQLNAWSATGTCPRTVSASYGLVREKTIPPRGGRRSARLTDLAPGITRTSGPFESTQAIAIAAGGALWRSAVSE